MVTDAMAAARAAVENAAAQFDDWERRRIADAYGVSEAALGRTLAPDTVQDDAERIAAAYGVRVESVRAILKKGQQDNG